MSNPYPTVWLSPSVRTHKYTNNVPTLWKGTFHGSTYFTSVLQVYLVTVLNVQIYLSWLLWLILKPEAQFSSLHYLELCDCLLGGGKVLQLTTGKAISWGAAMFASNKPPQYLKVEEWGSQCAVMWGRFEFWVTSDAIIDGLHFEPLIIGAALWWLKNRQQHQQSVFTV